MSCDNAESVVLHGIGEREECKGDGAQLSFPKKHSVALPGPDEKKDNNMDNFLAEENTNELSTLKEIHNKLNGGREGANVKKEIGEKPIRKFLGTLKNGRRNNSPPSREENYIGESTLCASKGHFEKEMNKYGLLDKIVHIEKLNNFFVSELGRNKKGSDCSPHHSPNASIDKEPILATAIKNEKGYTFPFQKRARSNSPPKTGVLFGKKATDDGPNDSTQVRKPLMATSNFVMGQAFKQPDFGPKVALAEQFTKYVDNDDPIDSCWLSTGPTDEDKHTQKLHSIEEDDSDWMYTRIGNDEGLSKTLLTQEEAESGEPCKPRNSCYFMKMLDSVQFQLQSRRMQLRQITNFR
eukprot:TRINITY_DN18677_c0_g1_i1.p1 TRINITY_DN18677_c0_g1~~TRINITY_DN18677_c0_g1_i1.p1  ORF type:complete len:352 (-),score=73.12 TRINITY_DN18677_c0_g1_i1:61-1116(-)